MTNAPPPESQSVDFCDTGYGEQKGKWATMTRPTDLNGRKKRKILREKDEFEKGETIPGEKGRTKVWEISLEQSPGTSCWDGLR